MTIILIFICVIVMLATTYWGLHIASYIKNQNQLLEQKQLEHEQVRKIHEEDYIKRNNYLDLKKQEAQQQFDESWKIFEDAQTKFALMDDQIKLLKQQVIKLQTELKSSRQKSQRLAKKTKNMVYK